MPLLDEPIDVSLQRSNAEHRLSVIFPDPIEAYDIFQKLDYYISECEKEDNDYIFDASVVAYFRTKDRLKKIKKYFEDYWLKGKNYNYLLHSLSCCRFERQFEVEIIYQIRFLLAKSSQEEQQRAKESYERGIHNITEERNKCANEINEIRTEIAEKISLRDDKALPDPDLLSRISYLFRPVNTEKDGRERAQQIIKLIKYDLERSKVQIGQATCDRIISYFIDLETKLYVPATTYVQDQTQGKIINEENGLGMTTSLKDSLPSLNGFSSHYDFIFKKTVATDKSKNQHTLYQLAQPINELTAEEKTLNNEVMNVFQHRSNKYFNWRKKFDLIKFSNGVNDEREKLEEGIISKSEYFWYQTVHILKEYAHSSGMPIGPKMLASHLFNFWRGTWNRHHQEAVVDTIFTYDSDAGLLVYGSEYSKFFSVEYILARLKKRIGDQLIEPNGDLHAILTVLYDRTGINYYSINVDAVLQEAERYKEQAIKERHSHEDHWTKHLRRL